MSAEGVVTTTVEEPAGRHGARLWSRQRRTPLYAFDRSRARTRRATDVVVLVLCLVGLAVLAEMAEPPSEFEKALVALVDATPGFLQIVWLVGAGLLGVWGVVLMVASAAKRRWDVLRDEVLAVAGAAGFVALTTQVVTGDLPRWWRTISATGPPAQVASARVAAVAAIAVVASPHLTRPFRMVGRWCLVYGAVSLVELGASSPTGALAGAFCGAAAAAIVHLALGSSGGRPSIDEVRQGLDDLGVDVRELSEGTRQRAGVYRLDAVATDGRALSVKVYGRDAWDSQLVSKLWRALWYRNADALTLTRVQQAEHEGFVALLAAENGVPVQDVVRAGRTSSNDAILVLRVRGTELGSGSGPVDDGAAAVVEQAVVDQAVVDQAVVEQCWDAVLGLAGAGFSHGDLAPEVFRLDGTTVVLDGLAGASVTPAVDQHRVDEAQLLVTTALLAGVDCAVETAARRLGEEELTSVLPYLQKPAFGPRLRQALGASDLDLDDLRADAATAVGVDPPKLASIRRVSASTLIQAGLLVGAAYVLITTLTGVDMSQVVDALSSATPWILVVALVFGQLPRFAQAESTRAACPRPVPYGPLAMLQFAITFVNLVVPSTAARVAVNIRFFQRQGIPAASAVSIGVVDGAGGFVVQAVILLSVWLFGFGNIHLDLEQGGGLAGGGLLVLLGVALAVVVLAVVVALVVPKLRAMVVDRVRPWAHEVLETLSALRSPSRVARLLGANLASEVLFASTLAIVLAALGTSLPLSTLLVINVGVSLFAGLMPVPGGIGVTEGALVVGLTAAGIDQATAFAAAIAYRICTFYLPPVWGGISFHRMERQGLL